MSWRSKLKHRQALIAVAVGVTFVAALLVWTRGADTMTDDDTYQARSDAPLSSSSRSAPSAIAASPSSSGAAGGTSAAGSSLAQGPALPDLPVSTLATSGRPRAVVVTVTSDEPIPSIGYKIAGGRPSEGLKKSVDSPFVLRSVGYGDGVLAVVGAQAGPYSKRLTCKITVDGKVRNTRTVRVPYSVNVCVG